MDLILRCWILLNSRKIPFGKNSYSQFLNDWVIHHQAKIVCAVHDHCKNQSLQEKQRAIQIRRNADLIGGIQEVLVEGRNQALGQWIGRTSDNRTLNFTSSNISSNDTSTSASGQDLVGKYLSVLVTRSGPNSLVGESVTVV